MAHKKAGGVTRLGRDSASQRLGVKISDGQFAKCGNIIIRQRGTKYFPGLNVGKGTDDTLFAMKSGFVKYAPKLKTKFDGSRKKINIVTIIPAEAKAPKAKIAKK